MAGPCSGRLTGAPCGGALNPGAWALAPGADPDIAGVATVGSEGLSADNGRGAGPKIWGAWTDHRHPIQTCMTGAPDPGNAVTIGPVVLAANPPMWRRYETDRVSGRRSPRRRTDEQANQPHPCRTG